MAIASSCATSASRASPPPTASTATGAVLGSPAYMSPEQASGGEIDARSDQFSLGAMLYQLATGALPFSGTSPLVTMAKIVKGDHAPPSAKNPRVPPYLERVIERLLRTAPDERFPSVDACAEALRDGLAADGFADVDAELAAYLRDPAGYNAAAEARIVDAALAQAERARARGETARALAAANRVLAWRPDEARALALDGGPGDAPAARRDRGGGASLRRRRRRARSVGARCECSRRAGPAIGRRARPEPAPTAMPPIERRRSRSRAGDDDAPPPTVAEPKKTATHQRRTRRRRRAPCGSRRSPCARRRAQSARRRAAPKRARRRAQPAADAPATLAVAIAPWCDLTIDGQSRGRSPTTLSLPPGPHHLVCVNPVSGQRLTRDLTLAAGERRELREQLYAMVRVQPRLTRGDAFAVDGAKPASAAAEVEPGRRRVTLYEARRRDRDRAGSTSRPAAAPRWTRRSWRAKNRDSDVAIRSRLRGKTRAIARGSPLARRRRA